MADISQITLPNNEVYYIKDATARAGLKTYSISISSNVITLTGSDGSTSTVTLPVYDGSVSSGGGS